MEFELSEYDAAKLAKERLSLQRILDRAYKDIRMVWEQQGLPLRKLFLVRKHANMCNTLRVLRRTVYQGERIDPAEELQKLGLITFLYTRRAAIWLVLSDVWKAFSPDEKLAFQASLEPLENMLKTRTNSSSLPGLESKVEYFQGKDIEDL